MRHFPGVFLPQDCPGKVLGGFSSNLFQKVSLSRQNQFKRFSLYNSLMDKQPAAASAPRANRRAALAVAVIAAASLGLRLIRAHEPIGGFHSFNSAWYATIVRNYHSVRDLLHPMVQGKPDFNVPPLMTWIAWAFTRMAGFSEFTLRLVPILFSVATLPVLYALGARLFGRRAGVAAAAFYAFAPVSMIVGRNIQTDAVYVFFMLASLLLYLDARQAAGRARAVRMAAAGLVYGAAFLTKQFAVILLPAIFLWECGGARGLRWITKEHILFGLAALLPVAPFYGYHMAHSAGSVVGAQSYILASQETGVGWRTARLLASEYYWGLSPLLAALCLGGMAWLLVRRRPGSGLVWAAALAFNGFFFFWHGHSYYMLFCLPFLALAAGALLQDIPRAAAAALAGGAAAALAIIMSLAMLCSLKYETDEYKVLMKTVSTQPYPHIVIASPVIYGSYHPVMNFYANGVQVYDEHEMVKELKGDAVALGRDTGAFLIGATAEDQQRYPPVQVIVRRRNVELHVLGFKIVPHMVSEHFFQIAHITVQRSGGFLQTGIIETGLKDTLVMGYAPRGAVLPTKNGQIDFRKNQGTENPITQ
jgi:MFS family permease